MVAEMANSRVVSEPQVRTASCGRDMVMVAQ
jgi:hypothetical protein